MSDQLILLWSHADPSNTGQPPNNLKYFLIVATSCFPSISIFKEKTSVLFSEFTAVYEIE